MVPYGIDIRFMEARQFFIPVKDASMPALLCENRAVSPTFQYIGEHAVISEDLMELGFIKHRHVGFAAPAPEHLHAYIVPNIRGVIVGVSFVIILRYLPHDVHRCRPTFTRSSLQ